jgi:hypothetical protein
VCIPSRETADGDWPYWRLEVVQEG